MIDLFKNRSIKRLILLLSDLLAINISALLALRIAFNFELSPEFLEYREILISSLPLYSFMVIASFYLFGLYRSLWKYASVREMISIVLASNISMVLVFLSFYLSGISLKLNFYVINALLIISLEMGIRFSYRMARILNLYSLRKKQVLSIKENSRILIVGAGYSGSTVAKEINNYPELNKTILGFLDDDASKIGEKIGGIKVLGSIDMAPCLAFDLKIDEIIIAIPSLSKKRRREVFEICKNLDVKLKTLPSLYEIIDGKVEIGQIRRVEIEDLLGRVPIKIDNPDIMEYIRGKRVLVTGGGGSIGSELCRQIASISPSLLLIFDIYENNAYDIQNELRQAYGESLNLKVLIGSVRDNDRLDEVFQEHRPEVVFHAAAHKHVPLMQENPFEAIKNNSIGTHNVAEMAGSYGVEKFVFISTDKAVNPSNIMGASKRLAEIAIQNIEYKYSDTEYMSVRFGNVLGSSGSVIPLFKEQIARGGPVTVTHPEVVRYFMTIPEAVQLVLEAGSMLVGGQIFVLDMGDPVKIVDLAKDLIKLSGFEVGEDIQIEFVGLRPGEKLYEELLLAEEGLKTTIHDKIFVITPESVSDEKMADVMDKINKAIRDRDIACLEAQLRRVIPNYRNID